MDSIKKRQLQMPEILLIAGASFAMAMIGFFIAVFYLQSRNTGEPATLNTQDALMQQKVNQLDALSADAAKNNPNTANTGNAPAENQADESDTKAAAKLKLLEKMNAN